MSPAIGLGVGIGLAGGLCGPAVPLPPNPNLLRFSEALDNPVWIQGGGVGIATDVTSAPNGEITADNIYYAGGATPLALTQLVLLGTGSGALHQLLITPGPSWARYSVTSTFNTGDYVFSVYIRDSGGGGDVTLRIRQVGTSVSCAIAGDLSGGDDFLAWGAQLELGTVPTGYQRKD